MRSVLRWVALGGVGLFLLIQLVPYGWWHENPPVERDAPWPDEASESIARESCYDCHSNETDWPVYAYVAPFSWLTRRDVEGGRDKLNFSEWDDDSDADEAIDVVEERSMPPVQYTWIHRGALSDEEAAELVAALEAMDDMDDMDDEGGDRSGPG